MSQTNKQYLCTFCKQNTTYAIGHSGSDAFICEDCLKACLHMYNKKKQEVLFKDQLDFEQFTPESIVYLLDQFVIGQEQAKKVLAVAAHNHFKFLKYMKEEQFSLDKVEIEKSNILMIGPTASGKTLLAKILATCFSVPFVVFDATSLTETGYVGQDVESILHRLVYAANGDIEKAQNGIVFLDEIDKLSKKNGGTSSARDISGEGVQQGLLKLLEGSIVSVPLQKSKKSAMQEEVFFDTTHVLFICAGTFVGLEEISKKRREKKQNIGFVQSTKKPKKEEEKKVDAPDLIQYGLISELVGRLPVVTTLEDLDEAMLLRVLKEPKNALIKQYQKLLSLSKIKLTFTEEALVVIAKEAKKKKIGVRGLRAVMENILLDAMYHAPSDPEISEIIVNENAVYHKRPCFVRSTKKELAK